MSMSELDRAIWEAAEIACIENVNESQTHNRKLQWAVEAFVKHTSEYSYQHKFPFTCSEWRELENRGLWQNILALIRGVRAPNGYTGITKAATARLIVEHFSDKPIFAAGKKKSAAPKASDYLMEWTVGKTATGRIPDETTAVAAQYAKECAALKEQAIKMHNDTDELIKVRLSAGDTLSIYNYAPGTTLTNAAHPASHLFTKTKENTMSTKAIKITNVTFVQVDGSTRVDIKDISLETAVDLIKQSENAILEFGKLKAQPKAVTKRIEELQAGIDALVKELDSREA